jgi:hypothetical protein
MKKFIFIAIFGLLAIFSQAQMATLNIPVNSSFVTLGTDYTLTNTTAQYLVVNAPQHSPTTLDFTVSLVKLTGTPTRVNIVLYGQKTADTPWVSIATGFWKVTTADTVMTLSNATANRYRNYKILYTPAGTGTSKIDKQDFKLYFE